MRTPGTSSVTSARRGRLATRAPARPRVRLSSADPRWLSRVWPQVYDTELHLQQAPWVRRALGGLQRLLHA